MEGRLEADPLITDAVMSGMSGTEKAGKLANRRPGLRIRAMSGYTEPQLGRLWDRFAKAVHAWKAGE